MQEATQIRLYLPYTERLKKMQNIAHLLGGCRCKRQMFVHHAGDDRPLNIAHEVDPAYRSFGHLIFRFEKKKIQSTGAAGISRP